jgi:hypothetical protein
LCGDEAGTTITSYSLVRRATGVTIDRSTGLLFRMIPPTITMPPIITALGSPFAELTNCARPIVPAAPPLFSNCTDCTSLAACIAAARLRPVWSQPPPGLAGIIIFSAMDCAEAAGRPKACRTDSDAPASANSRRFISVLLGRVDADFSRSAGAAASIRARPRNRNGRGSVRRRAGRSRPHAALDLLQEVALVILQRRDDDAAVAAQLEHRLVVAGAELFVAGQRHDPAHGDDHVAGAVGRPLDGGDRNQQLVVGFGDLGRLHRRHRPAHRFLDRRVAQAAGKIVGVQIDDRQFQLARLHAAPASSSRQRQQPADASSLPSVPFETRRRQA